MSVYLEVAGTPTPVADLFWLSRAACGCPSGVLVADLRDKVLTTPEQARMEMASGIEAVAERSVEDGETYELITREQFRATDMTSQCPHNPQWGVAKVDPPEGYVWATTDGGYGRRTFKRHLVPTGAVGDWRHKAAPLCGGRSAPGPGKSWGNEWYHLADTVTCRKCEARAVTP
jgi:hypothetical protein